MPISKICFIVYYSPTCFDRFCYPNQGFDVLLTMHLSIILVINQLNAQNIVL